jgi:hypothetical protein
MQQKICNTNDSAENMQQKKRSRKDIAGKNNRRDAAEKMQQKRCSRRDAVEK